MPLGMIVLFVVAGLVYFGLAQRVLDRMRLTDAQALAFLGGIIVGGLIDVPLARGNVNVSINVGGALVPLALAIYLLVRADTTWEWVRALLASLATAAAIWLIGSLTDFDVASATFLDPVWLTGLIGGVMGYLAGRSRRSAFIAGSVGVILADVAHLISVSMRGMRADVAIGGAGAFDAVVLAGVIAVIFAEVFGETRERLQGGPDTSSDRPLALHQDEGVNEGFTEGVDGGVNETKGDDNGGGPRE